MSLVQHIPLSLEQKKRLRVSLCGAGITVIAGACWAIFISMHFQDIYGPWLPRIGGIAYGLIAVVSVSLGLSVGVVGLLMQKAERSFRDIQGSFLACFGLGVIVCVLLLIFESIGRTASGGSFYPQIRTVFGYALLEGDRKILMDRAPQSKGIAKIQAVLDNPDYQSVNTLRNETSKWLPGDEATRALSMAMFFPEIKATKEYQRALSEGFMTEDDLEVWKKVAISLPPEAATQSRLHQEAWLRLAGHEKMKRPIRSEE